MLRRGTTRNNIPASQDKDCAKADILHWISFALPAAIILFPISLRAVEASYEVPFRPINTVLPLWQTNISDREWKTLNAPLAGSVSLSSSGVDLHHFDMPCQNCHAPADNASQAVGAKNNIGSLNQDISSSCSSMGCHEFNPVLNHSVGMFFSKDIAEAKPLDSQSRVTCLTCHYKEDTSEAAGNLASDDNREAQLYIPRGTNLCSSCHSRMGGGMKEQAHWQFSKKAHLGNISSASSMLSEEEPPVGMFSDVDAESRTCVNCHSDVSIIVPGEHETRAERRARWGRMTDHPIGMDYTRSSTKKAGRFRPVNGSMSDIRLFNGKVGCGSCHSLYSTTKRHVVKSSHGRSVCSACHIR